MFNRASIEHSDPGRGGAHRAIIARSLSSAQETSLKSALGAWHSRKRCCATLARIVHESLPRCLQGEAPTNASALLDVPRLISSPTPLLGTVGQTMARADSLCIFVFHRASISLVNQSTFDRKMYPKLVFCVLLCSSSPISVCLLSIDPIVAARTGGYYCPPLEGETRQILTACRRAPAQGKGGRGRRVAPLQMTRRFPSSLFLPDRHVRHHRASHIPPCVHIACVHLSLSLDLPGSSSSS